MTLSDALLAFWHEIWPGLNVLLLAALPSLLVGLSKIADLPHWLSWILQMASVLTHKDASGTLKLPLTVQDHVHQKARFGLSRRAVAPLLFFFCLGTFASCAFLQKHEAQIQCGGKAIAEKLPVLVPCIVEIATATPIDPGCLPALLAANADMYACAAQAAAVKLEALAQAPASASKNLTLPALSPDRAATAAKQLRDLIAHEGWRYAPAAPSDTKP